MESIVPGSQKGVCHYCGKRCETHKHHIFGGANRKLSEKYGLFIYLCPWHHNMSSHSVHFNKELMDMCHQIGQRAFEVDYQARNNGATKDNARTAFMKIFGRNYMKEDEV